MLWYAAWQLSAEGNLKLSLPSLTLFPTKVESSDLQVAGFLAGCWHLMRTLFDGWLRFLLLAPL